MSPVLAQLSGSWRTISVYFSHRGAARFRSSRWCTMKPPTCCKGPLRFTRSLAPMWFSSYTPA
eukprot:7727521-Ditylum_brightwellii.AAC.1